MSSAGRGRHFGWWRPLLEPLVKRLSVRGWPARLAYALGAQRRVDLVEHAVPVAAWPAGVRPLRLAFGSDFHAGPTTHRKFLELAGRRMAEAKPDVLLLGGDYIFIDAHFIDHLARVFAEVPAPLGKFAVLGNHDLWTDYRYITARLEEAGVRVLVNESAALPAPFDHVSVCGIDEYWSGDADGNKAFAGASGTRVLLIHSPCTLRAAAGHHFDVAVCGHTHGGHIALPGGKPIWLPQAELNGHYAHGRFSLAPDHQADLIVSRGIGALELPFRTYAPPDILALTMGPA